MTINRNLWLALLALAGVAPTTFAVEDESKPKKCEPKDSKNCPMQVPEGGSSLVYLLGAGFTCMGAMLIRSHVVKAKES